MKKAVLILAVFVVSLVSANAQSAKRVYGPKAKNQKVWINKSEKNDLVVKEKTGQTGGAAKNQKVWIKGTADAEELAINSADRNLPLKKKLAEKNYQRKHNPETIDMDSIDVNLTELQD